MAVSETANQEVTQLSTSEFTVALSDRTSWLDIDLRLEYRENTDDEQGACECGSRGSRKFASTYGLQLVGRTACHAGGHDRRRVGDDSRAAVEHVGRLSRHVSGCAGR